MHHYQNEGHDTHQPQYMDPTEANTICGSTHSIPPAQHKAYRLVSPTRYQDAAAACLADCDQTYSNARMCLSLLVPGVNATLIPAIRTKIVMQVQG